MRTLPFIVNQQLLQKADEKSFLNLIRGSVGYLKCSFTFDSSWDEFDKKVVEFIGRYKTDSEFYNLTSNEIDIPKTITALPYFKIKLYGIKGETRINTNEVLIRQKGS